MRISPIISFSANFIIYAIFDEDLSQDLSARVECDCVTNVSSLFTHSFIPSLILEHGVISADKSL